MPNTYLNCFYPLVPPRKITLIAAFEEAQSSVLGVGGLLGDQGSSVGATPVPHPPEAFDLLPGAAAAWHSPVVICVSGTQDNYTKCLVPPHSHSFGAENRHTVKLTREPKKVLHG